MPRRTAPAPLTPDALISALGESIRPLVSAHQAGNGRVRVCVAPGAAITSGQLVEAIRATPGVRITVTFAVMPPVLEVARS